MKAFLDEATRLEETIIKDRRTLHRHPEVGSELPDTTRYLLERLSSMGYRPKVLPGGVMATVGKGKRAFLLRGDSDALPVQEKTGLSFSSEIDGVSHACGHDTHSAMLLGAAQILKWHENELGGVVKLVFQSDQERLCGAQRLIDAGILHNPEVVAAMMLHIFSDRAPCGWIAYHPGVCTAGVDLVSIQIIGKGAHAARPYQAADSLGVAARILLELQGLTARELPVEERAVVSFGKFSGGSIYNILPDTAELEGSIRSYSAETRELLKQRVCEISQNIAKAFRCQCEVTFPSRAVEIINDPQLLSEAVASCRELLGENRVIEWPASMGGDDFAAFTHMLPGIRLSLGARPYNPNLVAPPHTSRVIFNEQALVVGAAVYANVAFEWLKLHSQDPSFLVD